MMKSLKQIFLTIFILFIVVSCSTQSKADMVIIGGKVATVDEDFSFVEAIAAQDGKIIFVGSNADVQKYIGNETNLIELDGELVLPGLIDAHGHLTGYGKSLEYIDLVGTESYQDILDLIRQKLINVKSGEWIQRKRLGSK